MRSRPVNAVRRPRSKNGVSRGRAVPRFVTRLVGSQPGLVCLLSAACVGGIIGSVGLFEILRASHSADASWPLQKEGWILFLGSIIAGVGSALLFVRVRAEARLRELQQCHAGELEQSEERLTLALRASQMGVWEWELATDKVFWSDGCMQIFDRTSSPATGADFFQLIHPEDRVGVEHRSRSAIAERKTFDMEFRILWPDGQVRWVANLGVAKYDSSGQAVRLLGTARDVTERKLTEDTLRASEERFRQLTENIQDVFWMTSPDKTQILYVSPAFEAIWGIPIADLYARPSLWLDSIHPGDRPRVLQAAMTRQASSEYDEQYRIHLKDGAERWIHDRAFPIRAPDGAVIRIAGIAKDITDLKHGEQQSAALLRELAAMKTALDEHAIVAITDQAGKIQYVNDLFCRISGYTREELLGRDHRIINSGYHSKEFIRGLWTTIASGRIWKGEMKNLAKNGSIYWVDTTIVPLMNEQGKPCQYVAIRADVTERKKFEEAMRTVNEELEARVAQRTGELERALEREKELSVLKSRFISMASHEFRTPLTAIQASSDLLRHYGERMNAQQKVERLDRIQGEVRNMTLLLEDVLFVGKSDAGRIEFKPEPTDLASVCEEMCHEIQAALRTEHAIQFTTNDARVVVPADQKLLRHIVTNLLSNAVKYSGDDSSPSLDLNFQPDRVLLTVRDHGIGIPSADLPRLFEPFHRGANVSDIPGTGLGLAIVKRSAELHGGSIAVESEVGRGTCFTVTIPVPAEKLP